VNATAEYLFIWTSPDTTSVHDFKFKYYNITINNHRKNIRNTNLKICNLGFGNGQLAFIDKKCVNEDLFGKKNRSSVELQHARQVGYLVVLYICEKTFKCTSAFLVVT